MTVLAVFLFLLSFVLYMHHISPGAFIFTQPAATHIFDSLIRLFGFGGLLIVVAA